MRKGYKIGVGMALIVLVILLVFSFQKNDQYKSYIREENENSISSILSAIRSNNEILADYNKSDHITYAELSRIGNNYLYAGDELKDLLKQVNHFMPDDNYSHENFNAIIVYFDGISLVISMDMLKEIGNYYPHLYNDDVYELNEDEKLVLGYMIDLNQSFNDIIIEKGLMSNQINSKEYNIDIDKNNGLVVLADFIDAMAIEAKEYFGKLKNPENSKLVEKFILDVSMWDR